MTQPTNTDDELQVITAIVQERLCEHGLDINLANCKLCSGEAIYTEADRKKHVLDARIDELATLSFRVKDALKPKEGPRAIVRIHLTDEFIDKRLAELKARREEKL